MPDRRSQGRAAEDQAAAFLLAQGITIVTRRFKCRHGELDLVVLDREMLAFVEVKQRLEPGARPVDAITPRKRALLHEAAQEYLRKMGEPERGYRIDLVAIDGKGIKHYPGALSS